VSAPENGLERAPMGTAVVRRRRSGSTRAPLDLETFARAANLHPELIRRFVELGLLEATRGAGGGLRFPPSQLAASARLQRLRRGFALNYAALGLVVDLLDRNAELEAALRMRAQPRGGRSWT
jgi:chaperone modulatory protein CbpM